MSTTTRRCPPRPAPRGPEDTLLTVALSASDADSSVASFTVQALPANGTLYIDAARTTAVVAGTAYPASGDALTLYFSPAANWNGGTSFTFFATDDLGLAGTAATASLTITAVNDAPVAADANASTDENAVLSANVPAASDVDGTVASYALASGVGAGNGSLVFNADGSYVFNPGSDFEALAAGASRDVSFTYTAIDNLGQASAPANLTITVNGINNAALLSADVVNLTEADSAAAISTTGVLSISDIDSPSTFVAQTATAGSHGSFSIDAAGAWTYTASSAHNEFVAGNNYTDSFTVSSADGTTTSVTINIAGSNDAAVFGPAVVNLTEGNSAAAISTGGTLTISDVDSPATFVAQTGTAGSYGSFAIDAAGAWAYTAASAHNEFVAGTTYTDTFAVASADGTTSSVTINIVGSNDAPLASAASVSTGENAVLNASVPAASDVDGTVASYALVSSVGTGNGSLTFNADGTYTFNPGSDFEALAAGASRDVSFAYAAIDNLGQASAAATVTVTVNGSNDAPVLVTPITNQSATENVAFSFTLPAGTFGDADAGDTLSYNARLSSGAALPSWLSFDAATRNFSGTPANADVGSLTVRVTATDSANATAFGDFTLAVANTNDAPLLNGPIADQSATEDVAFNFTLPAGTFGDVDAGDTLSYSARLSSGAALPPWLTFDAATRTFSGTPANADVGSLTVRVTATDSANATAIGDFALAVANVNDAPLLAQPIAGQAAAHDAPFSFTVPAATFIDIDVGDTLTYSAALASGDPLPSWLVFDGAALSFNGTPQTSDAGQLIVRVTATDSSGAGAQALFVIRVASPLVVAPAAAGCGRSTAGGRRCRRRDAELPPPYDRQAKPLYPCRPAAPSPSWRSISAAATASRAPSSRRASTDGVSALRTASRYDAVLADAVALPFAELASSPLSQLLRNDDLQRKFDEMLRQMNETSDARRLLAETGMVLSAGLSIGYVVWLVRGGVLISSMMSALPAWQMIDPMPILAAARKSSRKTTLEAEEPEVERLFDDAPSSRDGARVATPATKPSRIATPSPAPAPQGSADRQPATEVSP